MNRCAYQPYVKSSLPRTIMDCRAKPGNDCAGNGRTSPC
jgi:hypothetical protein